MTDMDLLDLSEELPHTNNSNKSPLTGNHTSPGQLSVTGDHTSPGQLPVMGSQTSHGQLPLTGDHTSSGQLPVTGDHSKSPECSIKVDLSKKSNTKSDSVAVENDISMMKPIPKPRHSRNKPQEAVSEPLLDITTAVQEQEQSVTNPSNQSSPAKPEDTSVQSSPKARRMFDTSRPELNTLFSGKDADLFQKSVFDSWIKEESPKTPTQDGSLNVSLITSADSASSLISSQTVDGHKPQQPSESKTSSASDVTPDNVAMITESRHTAGDSTTSGESTQPLVECRTLNMESSDILLSQSADRAASLDTAKKKKVPTATLR